MLKGTKHTVESIQRMRIVKLGKKMSEETKNKLSLANRNKIFSVERREKLRQSALRRRHTPETIEKIKKSKKGKNYRCGYKWPEEIKEKIRQTLKGKKLSDETKERMRNKVISLETRTRMSCRMKGKANPLWKGGITDGNKIIRRLFEYRLWRKAVFERDNHTCRICNKRNTYLNAHHIKSFSDYPELRHAIDNGITLCKECHRKQHFKIKEVI